MRTKILPILGLLLFLELSFTDLLMTWVLLHHGGGRVYEGNPIAGVFHARYGFTGLAAFKLTTLAYVGGVSLHVSRRYLMIGVFLVVFACLAAGSTVAYSWRILDSVP